MTASHLTHVDYDFSVLFAVPTHLTEDYEIIGAEGWFHEPAMPYQLRVRECCLDGFSDFGLLIERPRSTAQDGSSFERTHGLLLSDALANVDGFMELLDKLDEDWNFGGLIAVDRQTQLAFNTNCDVAETPEWRSILNALSSRALVERTFSLSDVGVRLERREGDLVIQQTAWEVPAAWGSRGSDHYPLHRFVNGVRCQKTLQRVLDSYDELREQLSQRGASTQAIQRLGRTKEA